ncbi:hypothetical protein SAMN05421847_1617 [Halpernia humi]|uniref:Uncharacterized protein n=1 Tax=Halpernia humi TaxID=493375 RepID=A0A1H5XZW4_9FLAO|nr:hypothetical protein [Halpernia humi]SEG17162.1 hypothetical protein SAMN05421847_1617 [Halpernia humi]
MEELIKLSNDKTSPIVYMYLRKFLFEPDNNGVIKIQIQIIKDEVLDENYKKIAETSDEMWEIYAENVVKYSGFDDFYLMPNMEINIFSDNPLISLYSDTELYCKIIGKPKDKFAFLGEMLFQLENKTKNWININQFFWNLENLFEVKKYPKQWIEFVDNSENEYITIPEFLFDTFKHVCDKHKIEIETETETMKDKVDLKILIFGNELVSSNDFYLNGPYIIAEKFSAKKLNK